MRTCSPIFIVSFQVTLIAYLSKLVTAQQDGQCSLLSRKCNAPPVIKQPDGVLYSVHCLCPRATRRSDLPILEQSYCIELQTKSIVNSLDLGEFRCVTPALICPLLETCRRQLLYSSTTAAMQALSTVLSGIRTNPVHSNVANCLLALASTLLQL